MRRRGPLWPLLIPLLAACGRPGTPPTPPSLGYDAVTPTAATYALGDTADVAVDAGGRTIDATVEAGMTLDVRFDPSPEGVGVTVSVRDFSARASNPMIPAQTARVDALAEPLVLSLDRRGRPTLVSAPEVDDDVARFLSLEATAATLFPRLPGRAVEIGHRWIDTVRVNAEQTDRRVHGSSVVSYMVAGDTLVEGRSLLRVTLEAEDHREIEGRRSGVQVSQSLDGGSTGWFLWDLSRGLLHESVYDSDLSGTMEMEAVPFPLSVRVRSRTELRVVDVPPTG